MGGFSDGKDSLKRIHFHQHLKSRMCYQASVSVDMQERWGTEKNEVTEMFVTVSTYQARAGEEDAIVALHEDWQRTLQPKAVGYISGELLRNVANACEFIVIKRFESRESAQALANDPKQHAWYRRLVSLVENVPVRAEYNSEWL